MYGLIDTHAHLEEIEGLDGVLAQARSAGVIAVIAVGSDRASNEKVLQIAKRYPGFVYPTLGLHPWNLDPAQIDSDFEFIDAHLDRSVAVGEVGLDYQKRVRENADKDFQQFALREVLQIARRHGKPAIIHSRYAWRDALSIVQQVGVAKAVFHWYTGPSSVLRDLISAGYYLSATPAVAYHEEHRRAVKEVPLDRLLLETDSPVTYRRGTPLEFRATPADVVKSLAGAAASRDVAESVLAEITTRSALALFSLAGIA